MQRVASEWTEHTSDWLAVICDRLCRFASLVDVVFMRGYEPMESGHNSPDKYLQATAFLSGSESETIV